MKATVGWTGMAISGAIGGAVIGSFLGTAGSIIVALISGIFGGVSGYYMYKKDGVKKENRFSSHS